MLIVTIRSCIEELKPLGLPNCEIIIVDNSDADVYEMLLKDFPAGYVTDGTVKVFRQDFPCLFSAREKAVSESSGHYVSCVDGHMLIGNNMFVDLVNFMDERADDETLGFAHAPINWLHQHERNAKHDRDMTACELGPWNLKYDHVRTINWKGMPWICKRSTWDFIGGYGALAKHHISWGGGDMFIGLKPWLLGLKNWAVPTSPGIHIGPFPKEKPSHDAKFMARDRYRLYSHSGEGPHSFGFLVACYIIGGMGMIERNRFDIARRFGESLSTDQWISKAKEVGQEDKNWLDMAKVTTFENLLNDPPWNYAN